MRTLIALTLLTLYACAVWYVAHGSKPVSIEPRAYQCLEASCSGIRLGEDL